VGVECPLWEVTTEQLEVLLDSPEAVDGLICGEPGCIKARKCLDLGKAWGVLHFLLTGEAYGESFPLGYAIPEPNERLWQQRCEVDAKHA